MFCFLGVSIESHLLERLTYVAQEKLTQEQREELNAGDQSNNQIGLSGCGKTILSYLQDDKIPNFNNFTGDKREIYRLTALACGGGAIGFDDFPKEGIDLEYFFCHMVEMRGRVAGEVIDACRIALIDKDGTVYSFVSDGLSRELDTLRSIFGNGPYREPMKIVVRKVTTRNKMQTFVMLPA